MKHPPWKVMITVTALTSVALVALWLGETIIAAAAGGALAGYLGKLNGQGQG